MRVERNVFWFVAFFLMTVATIYGLAETQDDAGPIILFLGGCLGAMCAAYLWVQARTASEGDEAAEPWFPDESIWPFVIGLASFFLFNGLILGTWFLVPGGALLTIGLLGWTAQTRDRT